MYKSFLIRYINSFRGLPVLAWRILITHFFSTILSGTLYFLTFYFVHILKFNIKQAAFFVSCYGIGSMIGGIVGGKLSDIYTPRMISIASLIIQGISFLLFMKFDTSLLLIFNIVMFGMATYSFITTNHVWVLSICQNNEGQKLKAINLLNVISNLGLGVSAVFLGFINNLNFKVLFLIYGMTFLLLACQLYFASNKLHSVRVIRQNKTSNKMIEPKQNRLAYFVLSSLFLIGLIISQMSSTYSFYIHQNFPEYGMSGFSMLFLVNTMLVVTIQAPIGSFLAGENKTKWAGYGALLIGFGMGMLAFATHFYGAILACVVYTIGEIIFFSLSLLICYENSPQEKRGYWTGIYRTVFALSRIVGPALGGLIYHHFNPRLLWVICCALGIFTFLSYRYLMRNSFISIVTEDELAEGLISD